MAGIFTRFMTKEWGWGQPIEVTTLLCMKSRSCLPLSVEASFQELPLVCAPYIIVYEETLSLSARGSEPQTNDPL